MENSRALPTPTEQDSTSSILICLLGAFRVLKGDQRVSMRSTGKTEALLCVLAFRFGRWVSRDQLCALSWPDKDPVQAIKSLHSLIHSLNRLLDVGSDRPLVLYSDGYYQLNTDAGLSVDTVEFERLVNAGNQYFRAGNIGLAAIPYRQAVEMYQGDLCTCTGAEVQATIERERLRARYLTVLARLADQAFEEKDYLTCLGYAHRILEKDPCREDAHRLLIRTYVRQGERAQAVRQFYLCRDILQGELDAPPEPATAELFDKVRLDPGSI